MNKIMKVMFGAILTSAVLITPFGQQANAYRGDNSPIELNVSGKVTDAWENPAMIVNGNTLVP